MKVLEDRSEYSQTVGLAAVPLTESDIRLIVRLLGETLSHPGPELDRKHFLLGGLACLVGADVWVWVAQKGGTTPGDVTYFSMIDGGWKSDRQRGIATGATWSKDNQPLHDLMQAKFFTNLRSDGYDDSAWYATELFKQFREPAELDDIMFTGVRISKDVTSTIGLHRSLGRPPFGERERRIAHIITSEVEWLHRSGIPEIDLAPVDDLSPRQRHVMLILLSGRSRKDLAAELSISTHTANEYVAQVYARLGVHSRAELMARFIRGELSKSRSNDV